MNYIRLFVYWQKKKTLGNDMNFVSNISKRKKKWNIYLNLSINAYYIYSVFERTRKW